MRLLDQVPVSRDEELEVEVTEKSMEFAKLPDREAETNQARGVLEWRFPLAAKKDLDLRFAFRVTFPKGRVVTGLE